MRILSCGYQAIERLVPRPQRSPSKPKPLWVTWHSNPVAKLCGGAMPIPLGYSLIDFKLCNLWAFPLKFVHERPLCQFQQYDHDRKLTNGLKNYLALLFIIYKDELVAQHFAGCIIASACRSVTVSQQFDRVSRPI